MNKMARQGMASGISCLLLCFAQSPAWANPGNGADHAARMQQKEGRHGVREARQEAHEQRVDARRKAGRLTPEERRALRRQINEAGQDLYQTPPKN